MEQTTNRGIKYAILLFKTHGSTEVECSLADDMRTWHGKLADCIDAEEVSYWKEWLGSMKWDSLMERQQLVLTSILSERPEVSDGESEMLSNRLAVAYYAYLLASPSFGCDGEFHHVSGQARSVATDVTLQSIKGLGDFRRIKRPFYRRRPAFIRVSPWQEPDPWPERWREWIRVLDAAYEQKMPVLLDIALASFATALRRTRLEFSIPDFVRAADCILATRQGKGKQDFVERTMQIAPELKKHWYVGGTDLEDRIRKLYDHRSHCVHGRVPFLELNARGEPGADEAARFEYLAEIIARKVLGWAFQRPAAYPALRDRALLDDAWNQKSFPF